MTMKKISENTTGIADLKARLSMHLQKVRQGHPLTLLDRGNPVAVITPYSNSVAKLVSRKPTRDPSEVRLPPPMKKRVNSLRALLEEREDKR